ncbi:hypothetical protein DERP_005146, partial [Dermatophagoides pteronyssinus]
IPNLDLLQDDILHFRLSIWICFVKIFFISELKFGFAARRYFPFLIWNLDLLPIWICWSTIFSMLNLKF